MSFARFAHSEPLSSLSPSRATTREPNLGTLEPCNLGTLEPWNRGTLEPWNLLNDFRLFDEIQLREILSEILVAALEDRILLAGANPAAGRFAIFIE